MSRRNVRRTIAQQMEAHIMAFKPVLEASAEGEAEEDAKEAARQLEYVQEPLIKKLRRAQGEGKQTGNLVVGIAAGPMLAQSNLTLAPSVVGAEVESDSLVDQD